MKRTGPVDELRVLYLAGPGDAAEVLATMAAGKDYTHIAHVAYSGQVFDVCRRLGAHLLSISTHRRLDDVRHGQLRAINIPDPLAGRRGIGYHLGNWAFAKIVKQHARDFRANVLITAPEPYPFLIQGLDRRGVHLVPALHAILLPEFRRPGLLRRLAVRLSRSFYRKRCTAILSHPGGAVRQVQALTGGRAQPIVEFLPLLRADAFEGVQPPQPDADVFRVMTVGRVEPDKGIFTLIEAAKIVRAQLGERVRFDVCGTGSALERARQQVIESGLERTMTLHGWTEMDKMTRLWGESHLAVVPTTSEFVEGFNQVVIEAALAGRPVVTSRVCPALEYVRACSIEVEVDNAAEYAAAVIGLAKDRARYRALQGHVAATVRPFLHPDNSFAAAVERVLRAVKEGRPVMPVQKPPEPGQQRGSALSRAST